MIRRLKIAILFISVFAVALSGWMVVESEYVNSGYDISGSLEGIESYGYSRSYAENGVFNHISVFKAPGGEYEVIISKGVFKKSLGLAKETSPGIYVLEFKSRRNYSDYREVAIISGGKVVMAAQLS